MERGRILVVDDDMEIRAMLRRTLLAERFDVDTAKSAEEGVKLAADRRPDAVVMDIGLPGQDGVDAVQTLRDSGLWMPVLMLTAHGEIERRVDSFRAGADDFLPKPFHPDELVLRLDALVRRGKGVASSDDRLRAGDTIIEPNTHRAWRGEREIELSPREYDVLRYFVEHSGHVLSRERIATAVWDGDIADGSNAVDVYIGYVRRKLEAGGEARVIRTVRGHGFIFDPVGERVT